MRPAHRGWGAFRHRLAPVLFVSGVLSSVSAAFAADTTPPSTPMVTDDGAYTASTTSLHAAWTSSDLESGIAEYQYLIRQGSTSGTIIVNWTSVGLATEVTHTALSLLQGKLYYVGVKAKNGAGLWSSVGYSNGIRVDTTAPSAPGTPTEGSSATDYDYDSDGTYTVYWTAASDAESGIGAYELQEWVGTTGAWTTLTSTTTSRSFTVSGRLHNTQYFYQVRAKNKAGLWGPWSPTSDGILVDKTAPSTVTTVTDDGAVNANSTTLHAIWTASSDPESGVVNYQYLIRQDSTSGTIGTILVNWTSVGLATEVTRTGLSLINGKLYYFGVRARNGAGLYSSTRYSDGILVQADTTPPTGSILIKSGAAYTNTPAVTLNLSATDDSGAISQMQCSNDNLTYTVPEPYATTKTWTLPSGDGTKTVYVKFSDSTGNWSPPVSASITLDTVSPTLVIVYPTNGLLLGGR